MSTKITKNTGREALEEFGPEGTSDTEKKFRAPRTDATIAAETFPSIGSAGPVPRTGSQQDKSNLQEQWEKVAQPIEEFQFLECDPIDLGEVVEECPLCVPNEYAYIFFDGKQCTQNIVLTVKSPVLNGPNSSELKSKAFQKEQKEEGIRLILDYFNRADTATVFYYVEEPPAPPGFASETLPMTSAVAGMGLGAILGYTTASGLNHPGKRTS